jgi:hypothetical protein
LPCAGALLVVAVDELEDDPDAVDDPDDDEDPEDDELDDDVELDPGGELGPAVVEVGDIVLALFIGADGDPPHPTSVTVARAVTRVTKQIFTRSSPALIWK